MLFLYKIVLGVVQVVFVILFLQNVVGQHVERICHLFLGHGIVDERPLVALEVWVI